MSTCLRQSHRHIAMVFHRTDRAAGTRCSGTLMARQPTVCLSPVPVLMLTLHWTDTTTQTCWWLLSGLDMVSTDSSAPQRRALASPTETGSLVAVGGQNLASSPRTPTVACSTPEGPDSLLNLLPLSMLDMFLRGLGQMF